MKKSYQQINRLLASQIKLVMADVDDTLTSDNLAFSEEVKEVIGNLVKQDLRVGLISGRNMFNLDTCAREIGINGPLIAENGGQVRLSPGSPPLFFGHQEIVLKAVETVKGLWGNSIKDGDWNQERVTDWILGCRDVPMDDLRRLVNQVDIIETNYQYNGYTIWHFAEKGINKSSALLSILFELGQSTLKPEIIQPENVLFLGDGPNDLSMFCNFPHTVWVPNPHLSREQTAILVKNARYVAEKPAGSGASAVLRHLLALRQHSQACALTL